MRSRPFWELMGPVECSELSEWFCGTLWSSCPWVCLDSAQQSPLLM